MPEIPVAPGMPSAAAKPTRCNVPLAAKVSKPSALAVHRNLPLAMMPRGAYRARSRRKLAGNGNWAAKAVSGSMSSRSMTSWPPVTLPSAPSLNPRLKLVGASTRFARVVNVRLEALIWRLPPSRFQSTCPPRLARSSCGRSRASRVRTSASSKSTTMPVGAPSAKSNHARSAPLPLSTRIGSGIHSRHSAMSA